MPVVPQYISVGSNRSSSCSACTSDGLLFFGAGKLIALWDSTSPRGVHVTLPGHKGQVTTVKLLPDGRLVSGDSIGDVRIWAESQGQWKSVMSWQAHRGASVSAIGAMSAKGHLDGVLVTGGSDGLVRIWRVGGSKPEEVQKIDLKGRLALDLDLAYLPGTQAPILAIGCTDRRIQIWTYASNIFTRSLSLEGHEDWVRCLQFTPYPSSSSTNDLLLASGSQDNFIRLWRVSPIAPQEAAAPDMDEGLEMLDEFEKRLAGEGGGNTQISTKAHILGVQDGDDAIKFNITLEALLVGHESGLTNVHWSTAPTTLSTTPLLLSTAADNSLIVWQPSSASISTDGIWVPTNRFGAIGGRGLAFYGAIWGQDGKSVLAGGWNGGWEKWVLGEDGSSWEVKRGLTGHHGDVQSIAWDPRGEYLLSVSSDQSSRIHAQCDLPSFPQPVWAEIARPQIHGYDMTDATFISPFRFASTADEKVTRVFDAPEGFVESLRTLGVSKRKRDEELRPKGATVPPLGLSNRALQKAPVDGDKVEKQGQNEAIVSISHTLTTLPTEEELATSTLWPEVEKVYGHGYELVAVASSHSGRFIATACKATNEEHAVIRVVSTSKWESVGHALQGHSLTITRLGFSGDDERILSCSRDRGWRVWQRRSANEEDGYALLAGEEKAHARMVLDCCWAGERSDMFATASRDKTVKIWIPSSPDSSQWVSSASVKLTEATTAVAVVAKPSSDGYLMAIGTESGSISVHSVNAEGSEVAHLETLDHRDTHVSTVNRLAWRDIDGALSLASCSDDRSVRVFSVDL
ncbi:elongator complex protein 2 [Cryptococcus wingfieldii CBS 7118]|uniref:Elongator complex protein 2 n=1 Tax=Cryptococcus wingfieldii CBS 7118 TaxID=1295528 RepID=A0A1E3JBX6_9TREE|nr:elongator complex protein 2 [Cryptococcus wingfieldii CBS 7118]ODN98383.1 elongator complex protein 2 [Cryptococcus wingfieldii CBS 7118]